MKTKKRKAGDIIGIIFYMLIGAGCGLLMVDLIETMQVDEQSMPQFVAMLIFLFLIMYLAIFLQIVIHEGGHLIFGLLTGYKFSSFRVGSFMWIEEDGKIKFKRYSLAGTGGQCLMAPPEMVNGRFPVVLYNLGGSIINALSGILFLIFALLTRPWPLVYYFFIIMAIVGVAFALMNGIPLSMGLVNNDGKNALSLGKDPKALRAIWIQLTMNHLLAHGVCITEMPEEWFLEPTEEDLQNNLTSALAVFRCSRLMEQRCFEEAKAETERLVNGDNAVAGIHKNMLKNDLIFYELIGECNKQRIDELNDKQQKQVAKAMRQNPSIMRTEYAYALFYEDNSVKAETIKADFDKMISSYPYQVEIESERRFMELAYERYIKMEEEQKHE